MKRLPIIVLLALAAIGFASCSLDKKTNDYSEWRDENLLYIAEQEQRLDEEGKPYFTKIVPAWDPQQFILIHWFNDKEKTKDNYSPILTSTVDVKYIGRNILDVPFDSSFVRTQPADSIFRTRLNTVISGWTIGITQMHVGDSCELVIPYTSAYGATSTGSILPYSTLIFDVKLVDIPGLVKK